MKKDYIKLCGALDEDFSNVNGKYVDPRDVAGWMKQFYRAELSSDDIGCITSLAEHAAHNFDIYEDDLDYEIPEWVFDLATEVFEEVTS